LKKAVGPIGSFIVEKQIKDMEEDKDDFPEEKLSVLIERAVENGIFDPNLRKSIASKMKRNIDLD
jgi:hypothetical protein